MPSTCKVCDSEDLEGLEADGILALAGDIPWSEVQRRWDLPNIKGIQNHMRKHWSAPASPTDEFYQEEFDPLVADSIKELSEQMRFAPAEVKPFYAIAIQNLKGLKDTKASQQHLINALKAIHEVTGMKMEQRLMLEFARHQFGIGTPEAAAAIEKHADVIDIEPSE